MKENNILFLLKKILIALSFFTGGIQIILYSLSSLFNITTGHNIESYFFPSEFIPSDIQSFWSIYILLYIILLGIEKLYGNRSAFNPKWLRYMLENKSEELYIFLRPVVMLFIDSFTRFIVAAIVYISTNNRMALQGLLGFSHGAISWYVKLWVLLLIIIYAFIYFASKKAIEVENQI